MRRTGAYRATLRAARAAAYFAPQVLTRVTATMRENMRLALGRADDRLVRATFRHFAEAAVDLAFFRRLFSVDRLEDHFRFEGGAREHYFDTKQEAAVLATGHFGNWELFGAAFSYFGVPLSSVARQDASWLSRRMDRFRRDYGQEIIPKRDALPLAMKALRRGAPVAMLVDQAAGRHGLTVPFFGQPASTYTAPAALALKLGVPLYAGYSTRLSEGIRYRCWAERVPVAEDDDVESLTTRLNGLLEGYVRARPEQWWWFHRRFKPRRLQRAGRPLTPAGVPASL